MVKANSSQEQGSAGLLLCVCVCLDVSVTGCCLYMLVLWYTGGRFRTHPTSHSMSAGIGSTCRIPLTQCPRLFSIGVSSTCLVHIFCRHFLFYLAPTLYQPRDWFGTAIFSLSFSVKTWISTLYRPCLVFQPGKSYFKIIIFIVLSPGALVKRYSLISSGRSWGYLFKRLVSSEWNKLWWDCPNSSFVPVDLKWITFKTKP